MSFKIKENPMKIRKRERKIKFYKRKPRPTNFDMENAVGGSVALTLTPVRSLSTFR